MIIIVYQKHKTYYISTQTKADNVKYSYIDVFCGTGFVNSSPRDRITAILQMSHSNALSWMKMLEFRLKFNRSLFLLIQLRIFQHWFRWRFGAFQETIHFCKLWWWNHRRIYTSRGLNSLIIFFYAHDEYICWLHRFVTFSILTHGHAHRR